MKKLRITPPPRILFIALFSLFTLSLMSCSDDDKESDQVDKSIVGTWQEDDMTDGIWRWTFKASGKGSCAVNNNGENYSFGYSFTYINGQLTVTGKEDGKTYTDHYTVTISEDGRRMTWKEQMNGYTITSTFTKR